MRHLQSTGTVNVGGREAPPSENVRQLRDEMSAAEAEGAAQLASLGAYDGGSSSSDGDGDDDDEQERYAQARHERVWGRKSARAGSSPEDGATGGLRSASSSPDGERSAAAVPAAAAADAAGAAAGARGGGQHPADHRQQD